LIEGSEIDSLSDNDSQVEKEGANKDSETQKSYPRNYHGKRTLGKKAAKARKLIREDLRELLGTEPKRSHKKRVDRPKLQSPAEKKTVLKVKSSQPLPKENPRDAKNSFNQAQELIKSF